MRLRNWKLIKAGSDSPQPTLSKADVTLKNHVDVKELNGFYLKDNIFVDFYLPWDPTVYPNVIEDCAEFILGIYEYFCNVVLHVWIDNFMQSLTFIRFILLYHYTLYLDMNEFITQTSKIEPMKNV